MGPVFAEHNDKKRFLLTIVDVLSRFAFVRPLQRKTPAEVVSAFESVVRQGGVTPGALHTVRGTEFYNTQMKAWLKKHDIRHYSTHSDKKAAMVERFNRTFKQTLVDYAIHTRQLRFMDHLNDFVNAYNARFHRTIKMAPQDVTVCNQYEVYNRVYGKYISKEHFPDMTFEKKVINATHPRNVILESTQGRIWVNTPLRDMLCYDQNPNVPLEKKYLVTDGQHAGRLMTQQFLKQTGSHSHFHEPFVEVHTDDLSTFDVDNGIQLDHSSLPSSYSFPQIQNFLVYADFIKNRPVGSIRTGLLIAVNNPGLDARLYGASYSHFNSNPLFMPTEDVVRNNFNFVVRDDNGAIMDFDWGTTSLELHFRRRRNAKLGWSEMI